MLCMVCAVSDAACILLLLAVVASLHIILLIYYVSTNTSDMVTGGHDNQDNIQGKRSYLDE